MEKTSKKEKLNFGELKEIFDYIKEYKKNFIWMTLVMAFSTLIMVIMPIFWGTIFRYVVEKREFTEVIKMLGFTLLINAASKYSFRLQIYHYWKYISGSRKTLRYRLYEKIINLEVEAFDKIRNGEFLNRVDNEITKITTIFEQFTQAVVSFIKIIVTLVVVFTINIPIGVLVIVSMVANYYNFKIAGAKIKTFQKEGRKAADDIKSNLQQSLTGIREVKSLGIKEVNFKKFRDDFEKSLNIEHKRIKTWANQSTIMRTLEMVTRFSGITLAIYLFYKGTFKLEFLYALQTYLVSLNNELWRLGTFNEKLKDLEVSIERVMYILKNKDYKDEKFGEVETINVNGSIEFKNVTFAYGDDEKVFKGLNLKVKPNQITAIVGKSGGGKSTIFSLLTRFYNVEAGKICIDSLDIKEFTEKSLRKAISVIRQEPFLFNVSIKDNLKMVRENITDEEMHQACKKAHIHHYIEELEDGYDAVVGEGGINFSGGQKQRIAIARALLKGSKIMLFDEATSALDNEAQNVIKETIEELKEDHTIIVIAHRLSTIIDADKIIVIEDGVVKNEGQHESLLEECETYASLYQLNTV